MLPALKVGGVYRASVLQILADRRIRILVEGEVLLARVETQVREGEQVFVEVDRLMPELVFRVRRTRKKVPC